MKNTADNLLPLKRFFDKKSWQFKKLQSHGYTYYSFSPTLDDLRLVKYIAVNKAIKTNNADQNGNERDLNTKIHKQFMGDLAELAVTKFLVNVIHLEESKVKWWDVERETFDYSKNEYDVAILGEGNTFIEVNVRASFYKESKNIGEMFLSDKMDYITSYTNSVKQKENEGDISLRVIYSFPKSFKSKLPNNSKTKAFYNTFDFFKYLTTKDNNEFLRIYVVGFAPTSLIKDKQKEKSLSQKNTKYKTIHIREGLPIEKLGAWIKERIEN